MKINLSEKIADWLFDIAKYVATAVLISSFLGGFRDTWLLYVSGAIVISSTFLGAVWIIKHINKTTK
ncbi:MAG: hypothetical protein FWC98_03530 [Bacteroidales bacterium]|nr:hypothetical protein [Bacteroidales bacterium]